MMTMSTGAFYAPYKPVMSWQSMLDYLHANKQLYTDIADRESDESVLHQINEMMQDKFPGSYIVEEYYDASRMRFAFKLKFDSPKQETMFKLKYPS